MSLRTHLSSKAEGVEVRCEVNSRHLLQFHDSNEERNNELRHPFIKSYLTHPALNQALHTPHPSLSSATLTPLPQPSHSQP